MMGRTSSRVIVAAFATALGVTYASFANAQSARETLLDRDQVRSGAEGIGTSRVENWFDFQRNINGSELWQYWPRFYIPFNLQRGWTFTQRVDLPMDYTDGAGSENPAGKWKFGIGDWFIEEIVTTPEVAKNTSFWASARFVFPTGGLAPFGNGQYEWAPALGMLYSLPEHALTFGPVARYFMSYHATEGAAGKVRTLDLYPIVTFGLTEEWSLSFYSDNPIIYNDVTHKWFVPIDVLLHKRVNKNLDLTFGGAYGLVKDVPQYQYIINGSIALYF